MNSPGIIGPKRLNDARIVPMVDYTARVMGKLLERGISFVMITDALTNPLQVIKQANGNTLYIGARAKVVLSPKGWMVIPTAIGCDSLGIPKAAI